MKFLNSKKNLFLFVLLVLVYSCNYKPLFNKDNLKELNFKIIEISGDKRITQIVGNKLNITRDKTGSLALFIHGKKNTSVSNKSTTGKALEYSVTLSYRVEVKNNLTGKTIYSKNISNTENYKASDMYSDTINSEKKIIENISSLVAKQIINEISLVLRNDI